MKNIKLDLSPLYDKIKVELESQVKNVIVPNMVPALTAELGQEVDSFVKQVQEKIVKPRTPYRTGKLRSSIILVVDHRNQKNLVIRCYAGYPTRKGVAYAAAIEFGTASHTIEASKKKVLHFVGKKLLPRKKFQHRTTYRYSKKATQDVFRQSVYVSGIHKVEMFQAGLDFIYQNLPKVLAHKMNTIDFTKFRFKAGGRQFTSYAKANRPQIVKSSHTPGTSGGGSFKATEDINLSSDLKTLKEFGF